MLNRKIEQRGFGAIQGLLILVVACVIASATWLMYSHYQKAHQAKSTSSTPTNTSTVKTPVHTQQPAAVANLNNINYGAR